MKKWILACLLCSSLVTVMAQESDKKWEFSVGPAVSAPIGNFKDYYNMGYGGNVQVSYKISDKFSWYIETGYSIFSGKKNTYQVYGFPFEYTSPKINYIPILGGPKYTIGNFSVGLAAGVGIYNFKNEGNAYSVISDTTGVSFTYSPEIDFNAGKFKIAASYTSSTVKLDEQLSGFVNIKNATFISLKLFYKF